MQWTPNTVLLLEKKKKNVEDKMQKMEKTRAKENGIYSDKSAKDARLLYFEKMNLFSGLDVCKITKWTSGTGLLPYIFSSCWFGMNFFTLW